MELGAIGVYWAESCGWKCGYSIIIISPVYISGNFPKNFPVYNKLKEAGGGL